MTDIHHGLRLQVRVALRQQLADDIIGLRLEAADGGPLPAATAGAHIDLTLPGGHVRQYSISNAPCTRAYELGILRDPRSRGGSAAAHAAVQQGDQLQISPPRNLFPLHGADRRVRLFAGGIGITPIIAMADALQVKHTPFTLHYCSRSKARAAFLGRLAAAPYADVVQLFHDDTPGGSGFDAATALAAPQPGDAVYVCGPNGFMDHVLATARGLGWQASALHSERFGAAPPAADAGSFDLVLARSHRTLRVGSDESALSALLAAGIEVPMSCEQGICGSCLTRVLEGEPEHRDVFLTEAERAANHCFTPCCSRARGRRLVVDL